MVSTIYALMTILYLVGGDKILVSNISGQTYVGDFETNNKFTNLSKPTDASVAGQILRADYAIVKSNQTLERNSMLLNKESENRRLEVTTEDTEQRKQSFELRENSVEGRKWKTNYQSTLEDESSDNEAATSAARMGGSNDFSSTPLEVSQKLFKSSAVYNNEAVHTNSSLRNASDFREYLREYSVHREEVTKTNAPVLIFENPPVGDPYEMEKLGLTSGIFVFTYLGDFLSFIQPLDFPVELLRDALWKRLSVVSLIMQSLKVEAGFVTCLTLGLMFSLFIPVFALAATCSNVCVPKKLTSDSVSMNGRGNGNCTRRSLVCGLFVVIVMVGAGVTAMLITNEQLSNAMLNSPRVWSVALNDAAAYVKNAHQQLVHVTLVNLDNALDALYTDMEEIETLLGRPIQKEIAAETGVDVALDSLVDIATATNELAKMVGKIQDASLEMRDMSSETRQRLADLRHQVDSLRRSCPTKDKPLCDTIESSGLEITIRSDGLNTDPRLTVLRSMESGNLPKLAERIRSRFADIPFEIASSTRETRDGIKRELEHRKAELDASFWPIESLVRDVRSRINDARAVTSSIDESVVEVEQWRWLTKLGACLLVILIWVLLLCALLYACCDGEQKARSFLITALFISSICSILLWVAALIVLVVGGHGEVFVCRPLYDKPGYRSLTELVDDPGVLYKKGGGFLKNVLSKNQTLAVPVRRILQECEENRPVYEAFRLKNILDLERTTSHKDWRTFFLLLKNLDRNFTQLEFLDPELQERLHTLSHAAAVNMSVYRSQLAKPMTGRDLNSFAKQLDSVANQIKDLTTASRIETLASRTRRLIASNIRPLETKKEELAYMVTAFEVQIGPLQRQVNQSISHLKTIQYYINNQGGNISETKVSAFTRRLTGYLDQFRSQLQEALTNSVASCLPLWNVFHGVRHHICRQIMDPLNGFWFALVWCLLWLALGTPICIKLIHYYRVGKERLLESSTSSSMNSTERGNGWATHEVEENNW